MPESNKPFVVTDRRKFTKEGELRPDAEPTPSEPRPRAVSEPQQEARPQPTPISSPLPMETPQAAAAPDQAGPAGASTDGYDALPAPTPEQMEQSRRAYEATAERIETAIRAADPGAEHPPAMNFDGLVQSVYLTTIMQLGGATPEGERPRVDLISARQSIDMLAVLSDRTQGNLSPQETQLLDSALFELRMAFLEITQALARSAAPKAGGPVGMPGAPRGGIVL